MINHNDGPNIKLKWAKLSNIRSLKSAVFSGCDHLICIPTTHIVYKRNEYANICILCGKNVQTGTLSAVCSCCCIGGSASISRTSSNASWESTIANGQPDSPFRWCKSSLPEPNQTQPELQLDFVVTQLLMDIKKSKLNFNLYCYLQTIN